MEINEFPDIHLFNGSTKYFWQNRKIERSNNLFFNFVLPQVDGLALMTKTLEEYFATKTGSKTKTIHLPMTVDLSRFDLTKVYDIHGDIHCPYIAFLGSMNDLKDGVNILIESFISLSADFPNYNLFIFGFWGYDSKKHLQLIQESQIGHRILYSRPINNTEVEKVLMNASVLVLPRPDSYQAQGGFPTKLGEYLATGNPVISTRVGEIDNYLINNENVFFCEPGSVQSLTSTLRYVLKNYDFAKKIGRRGRLVAEKVFSIDVQTKRLFYFLKNLQ
jgi:glycosyltransferase involved in cell wall biosynthesis